MLAERLIEGWVPHSPFWDFQWWRTWAVSDTTPWCGPLFGTFPELTGFSCTSTHKRLNCCLSDGIKQLIDYSILTRTPSHKYSIVTLIRNRPVLEAKLQKLSQIELAIRVHTSNHMFWGIKTQTIESERQKTATQWWGRCPPNYLALT